ncbi:MAG: hypothetical protein ACUVTX_10535 [Bacteroidales bacterium]
MNSANDFIPSQCSYSPFIEDDIVMSLVTTGIAVSEHPVAPIGLPKEFKSVIYNNGFRYGPGFFQIVLGQSSLGII